MSSSSSIPRMNFYYRIMQFHVKRDVSSHRIESNFLITSHLHNLIKFSASNDKKKLVKSLKSVRKWRRRERMNENACLESNCVNAHLILSEIQFPNEELLWSLKSSSSLSSFSSLMILLSNPCLLLNKQVSTIHHVIIINNFSTEILTLHVHYQEIQLNKCCAIIEIGLVWWLFYLLICVKTISRDYSCLSKFSFLFFSQIRMDHVKEKLCACVNRQGKKSGSTQCGENGAFKTRDICWMAENNKNGSKITLKKK